MRDTGAEEAFGRLRACAVVPVVTFQRPEDAPAVAEALAEGGIDAIEITLRSEAGLRAIEAVARAQPGVLVVAGTVLEPGDFARARDAGAGVAVSPGFTAKLDEGARAAGLPWMPGVATASEAMAALERGRAFLKLFPAGAVGGVELLRALRGPLPRASFCPTGGVGAGNLAAYLALPNVAAVGGTWLAPAPAEAALADRAALVARAAAARAAADAARAGAAG